MIDASVVPTIVVKSKVPAPLVVRACPLVPSPPAAVIIFAAVTMASVYALVEASVLLVGVGTVTVPVNVGEARFAFRSRAVC